MKNYYITLILFVLIWNPFPGHTQANKTFLEQIVNHNPELKQARYQLDAEKYGHKTGIAPSGPEIEAGYFPGKDNLVKNTFGVSQKFDLPMLYSRRIKRSRIQQKASEALYHQRKMEILQQAQKTAFRFRYLQNVIAVMETRQQHAEELLSAFEKMLEQGDANILEVNKIKVSMLEITEQLALRQQELENTRNQLKQMTNGQVIQYEDLVFPGKITQNREQYIDEAMAQAPEFIFAKKQTLADSLTLKVQQADNWPSFMVGYEYEAIDPEYFSGIKAGISIPLWQNQHKTNEAKARVMAAQAGENALKLQLETYLSNIYNDYRQVNKSYNDYRQTLDDLKSTELLMKSLELGHISLIEYLLELKFFYAATDRMLELEFRSALLNAELRKYQYLNL